MWEFPKIRGPNTDPKHEGSYYKDTQEMDPQFIETTMLSLQDLPQKDSRWSSDFLEALLLEQDFRAEAQSLSYQN